MLKVQVRIFFAALFALCTLTACSNPRKNVMSTLFIHKYGAAIEENDWYNRGGNGQIVTDYKNGVTITQNFVNGDLEGKTTYSFPFSSLIEKEELYRQGHRISTTTHFTSGVPKEKIENPSQSKTIITQWFESGQPKSIENFIDGRLDEGEYYSNSNEIESRVKAGEGLKIERNAYGEFVSKTEFKNGEKRLTTTFHSNGDPKTITPYLHGQIHGTKKIFLINGVPDRFETWKEGQQQGETQIFRDGQCYSKQSYVAGTKNGLEKIFNEAGDLACEITWKNDLKHGVLKNYYHDTIRMEWYYYGRKVSHADFENLIFER